MRTPDALPTGHADPLDHPGADVETEGEELARRRPGRFRRMAVPVLVVLACLSFAVAVPGSWARRNVLDSDRFVDRTAAVLDQPAVQDALATRVTQQLMLVIDPRALFEEVLPGRGQVLAVPLTNAVEGFVHDRAEAFVASDRFADLWRAAVTVAHTAAVKVLRDESDAVRTADGTVTLDLVPALRAVLTEITSSSPELLGRVDPEAVIARAEGALGDDFGQITVYDDGKLEAAQNGVATVDRIVPALLPASVLFAALALALSYRRRRTLLQLAGAVLLTMVLLRRVAFVLQDEVAALVPTAQRAATAAALEQFLDPLRTFALWSALVALVVIAVAVLSGPYRWAVALRGWVAGLRTRPVAASSGGGGERPAVAFLQAHRDALLVGGGVAGLVLLWALELSWVGVLVLVAALVAAEIAVYRVGAPGAPVAAPDPTV